jgi:hypothetical protein
MTAALPGTGTRSGPDRPDPIDQFVHLERLRDVVQGTQLHPLGLVPDLSLDGEHHHRKIGQFPVGPHQPQRLPAAHAGHVDVQQDQIERFAERRIQRFFAAGHRLQHVPFRGQDLLREFTDLRLVVHHQDFPVFGHSSPPYTRRVRAQ